MNASTKFEKKKEEILKMGDLFIQQFQQLGYIIGYEECYMKYDIPPSLEANIKG